MLADELTFMVWVQLSDSQALHVCVTDCRTMCALHAYPAAATQTVFAHTNSAHTYPRTYIQAEGTDLVLGINGITRMRLFIPECIITIAWRRQ
jgi:hypothetical protein